MRITLGILGLASDYETWSCNVQRYLGCSNPPLLERLNGMSDLDRVKWVLRESLRQGDSQSISLKQANVSAQEQLTSLRAFSGK